MHSAYRPNYRHYEHYDRRVYGRPHYGLNPPPRAASIHVASSVHSFSRRSGGTLMRAGAGADAQSTVMREERKRRAKTRCLVTVGVLLPAMAGIIGVVAYAVSAENYGRTPLGPRSTSEGVKLGSLADSEGSRRRASNSAENRMDTFEVKSASNHVPMKQLPPRTREPDHERESQLNALNPGPALNIGDSLTKPWQEPRQRTTSHQSDNNRIRGKVYFDNEQTDVPLRHGDGSPEEVFHDSRQKHFQQADPSFTQRVGSDPALPDLGSSDHASQTIQAAAPQHSSFLKDSQVPHVPQSSQHWSSSSVLQQQHQTQQQIHSQQAVHPVDSHRLPYQAASPASRTLPIMPPLMQLPTNAEVPQTQHQQQQQRPVLSPSNGARFAASEMKPPATHHNQQGSPLTVSSQMMGAHAKLHQSIRTITAPVVQMPKTSHSSRTPQTVVIDTSQPSTGMADGTSGDAFVEGAIPSGMREQQITVVDNDTKKGYVIHFLVRDNDENSDGTVGGFDPNSPAFHDYIRQIIRQQQEQEDQDVVQTMEMSPTASSNSSSTMAPTAFATMPTATRVPRTTLAPFITTTTKTAVTTEAPTSIAMTSKSTLTNSTVTTKKPIEVSSTNRMQRPLAPKVPQIRPRVQARFSLKATTKGPTESTEYEDDEEDDEGEQEADPSYTDDAVSVASEDQDSGRNSQGQMRANQNVRVNTPRPQRQPPSFKHHRPSKVPTMAATSTMPKNILKDKYMPPPLPPPASTMIKPARPVSNEGHQSTQASPLKVMTSTPSTVKSSTASTARPRPTRPKPIFYSEANRRDTTSSSQNPFKPPSPIDYPQTNRPLKPPTQIFSSTKQRATFANAPFRPPSPPRTTFLGRIGSVPGFEPQLIEAEPQLSKLAGVHVLPDGGLLLPAPQLTPQYPPTVAIPPPPPATQADPNAQTNRLKRTRKVKGGKKSKKPKKDRFGIEIGGSHGDDDDDSGSGITLSLGRTSISLQYS
ncbi:mucin-5AC-like isoform X3 [Varroa destructor]|uniref:Uncharacterized protein n=1 Tax=Varroa destructor TaxID=109461 RepID=A0A7M7KJS5_VARDE|nr:mucin-5AC-like isoform X3 [Varroa destructor]